MLPLVKNLGPPGEGPFYPRGIQITAALKKRSRALTHITSRVRCVLSTDTPSLLTCGWSKHRWANRGNRYSHEVLQELLLLRGVGRGITSHGLWGHRGGHSAGRDGKSTETVKGLWTRPGVIVKAYGNRVDGKISLGETRGLDWHKIFQMKLLSL